MKSKSTLFFKFKARKPALIFLVFFSLFFDSIVFAQDKEATEKAEQEVSMKKMMMAFSYGHYKIQYLNEPLDSKGTEINLRKEEEDVILTKDAIREGVANSLKTLMFDYSSSSSSSFEIDKAFFDTPGLKNQAEITVYFDEILDNYGHNIVEAGTKELLVGKNFTRYTSDDNISFSASFNEELEERKPYKAKGNVVVKLRNLERELKLSKNDVGVEKKIGNLSFKIVRFDKAGVILETPGNDDLIEYNYKKDGLTFINRMSYGAYKDNPLFEIFKKYDHPLSEKELEEIAKDIDFEQLMKKQDQSKGAIKCVVLGDTPDEIIIRSYGIDTQEQFPFEVFNEGVRLRKEPVFFETIDKEKLQILQIGGEEFSDDTDIQDITEIEMAGTNDYENLKVYKTLPSELLKFTNLERLRFNVAIDADLSQIEGILKQLIYLKNIEIEGKEIENEEGNYQFHGFKSFPSVLLENKNLEEIRLTGHLFASIPENTLSKALKLRYITFSENLLTKIPDDIALLKSLKFMDFSNNYIAQLSEGICKLTELQIIRMHDNRLTRFPNCLISSEVLEELDVDRNGLVKFLKPLTSLNENIFSTRDQKELTPLSENDFYQEKLEQSKN